MKPHNSALIPPLFAHKNRDRLREGYAAFELGQWETAVELWQAALADFRKQVDREGELYSLCYLSHGYFSLVQYDQSIDYLEDCSSLAIQLNHTDQQAQVADSLSNLSLVLESEQLIEKSSQLLKLAQKLERTDTEISLLLRLGDAYATQQLWLQGLATYQRSLNIAQTTLDSTNESRTLIRLGNLHQQQQQLDAAIQFQEQALDVATRNNNPNFRASALVNIANIQRDRAQYQSSIQFLQKALTIRQEEIDDDDYEESIIYGNLGNLYKDLGHYTIAIQYQQNSLNIAQQTDNTQQEIIALNSLGSTYADRSDLEEGDYATAIDYFQKSLALAESNRDRRAQAETLNNLGSVYHRQLEYATAKTYYEQGLEIARKIGNRPLIAGALADMGFVNAGLQDYPTALDYYEKGIAKLKEIQADRAIAQALNNRAHTFLVWGQSEKANGQLEQATDKFEKAEANLQESTAILEKIWQQIDSDLDRVSLFDTQQMTYNLTQQVLIEQGSKQHTAKALQSSEEGRGRAFARVLANKFGHTLTPPTPEHIQDIARSRNLTLVEYAIMPQDDVIHQGKHTGKAGQIYIWVVQPTGDIHFQSVDLAGQNIDLEALVQYSRDSIGARNRGFEVVSPDQRIQNTQQLKDLHKLLIAPIQQWLPTEATDKVVFIPHRELFLVPFSALQNPDDEYLISHHTPIIAPSIQLLDLTRQQHRALPNSTELNSENVLIVGNPEMPDYWDGKRLARLSSLANAQIEASNIGQLFQAVPFIGKDATELAVVARMKDAALIHLATHGLLEYRNENPTAPQEFPGAIALTATRSDIATQQPTESSDLTLRTNHPEDGLLTASEIADLTLQAQLVVLSACDTGRGDLSGDGVLGLARSLITAGSPSILVSLWSVPDAPTSQLMQRFYHHWQIENLDKAQALRQAMLDTQKTNPNPNDWAAFSLIGEYE